MTYVVTDEQIEALLATIQGLRCDSQPSGSIRNHTIDTVDAALRLWVALVRNASSGHDDDDCSMEWGKVAEFYYAGYLQGYRMGCNHAAELNYRRKAAAHGIIGRYENATLHYELALHAIVNNVFLYEDPLSKEVFAYYRPRT